ncbi:MAG TPA: hypothetical protein VKM55_04735 [Candidatus Lokiarchaeia archaeon]|nr:hypothetical protein [Candidatus Lokiarchaeia archaeon]
MGNEYQPTSAGWIKANENPVLGGNLGTCFDISVLEDGHKYRMWFSWRPKESIALVESDDGIQWNAPTIVLGPNSMSKWEERLNRPCVLHTDNTYHMWYTGQTAKRSFIGYATSLDGMTWHRKSEKPVLEAKLRWENKSLMCPHVIWDEQQGAFRMWYSAGGQYEPRMIAHATSPDGIHWTKLKKPVFLPDRKNPWEKDRVAACQVIHVQDWFVMFYIGFSDIDHARIGIARSRDGIAGWERHPANPIIAPTPGSWDHDACYKPYAIYDGKQWMLWYNGRHGDTEQIGVAMHPGEDLGFDGSQD